MAQEASSITTMLLDDHGKIVSESVGAWPAAKCVGSNLFQLVAERFPGCPAPERLPHEGDSGQWSLVQGYGSGFRRLTVQRLADPVGIATWVATLGPETNQLAEGEDSSQTQTQHQGLLEATAARACRIGSWIADLSTGEFEWSSEMARIFELPCDQRVGSVEDIVRLIRPADRSRARQFLVGSAENFKLSDIEVRLASEVEERILELEGEVLVNADRTRMVGICRDVTMERRVVADRRQSQRLEVMGRLAGGIAHDYNNILMVIQGMSQLMRRSTTCGTTIRRIDEIQQAADRGANLSRQLLAFSSKQTVAFWQLDLNAVIESLRLLLQRLIGEHISLEHVPDDEIGAIRADRTLIEQVLINLVVNARDAMPAGGTLTLRTSRVETLPADLDDTWQGGRVPEGLYVCLEVEDNGTGMDAEVRQRIFEPFYTTKTKDTGTGLGLATVYGIVRQHQGRLRVDSKLGVGTRFHVYFPQASGSADPLEDGSPCLVEGRGTILLVEDEASVRRVLGELLRALGYEVLEADDLRAVEEWTMRYDGAIDLLVTDVVLPSAHGTDLARIVRRRDPNAAVLYLSGYGAGVLDEADLTQGTCFMRKPINSGLLSEKIRTLLLETRRPENLSDFTRAD